MATTEEQPAVTTAGYDLTGTLLEACSCNIMCPCWVGEDPDLGHCDAFIAYNLDEGSTIRGIDVSGLSFVSVAKIPGNVLAGNWRIVVFVDEKASEEQSQAMLDAFTGKLGGPLADLAQLIGEVSGVERAPITHTIEEGAGMLRIGDVAFAELEPYRGPDGSVTTLHNSVFSTVPGSPAWVGKTSKGAAKLPDYGMEWTYDNSNAIQSDWHITHTG